jgi:hypothetical protein
VIIAVIIAVAPLVMVQIGGFGLAVSDRPRGTSEFYAAALGVLITLGLFVLPSLIQSRRALLAIAPDGQVAYFGGHILWLTMGCVVALRALANGPQPGDFENVIAGLVGVGLLTILALVLRLWTPPKRRWASGTATRKRARAFYTTAGDDRRQDDA